MFEALAVSCRGYFDGQDIVYDMLSPRFDEKQIAVAICDFLKSQGFRPADGTISYILMKQRRNSHH